MARNPQAVEEAAKRADEAIQALQGNTAQAPDTTPDPTPDPTPAPAPVATPAPADDDASWQHKYQVIAGKYNAETRQLRDQLRVLQTKLDSLAAAQAPADSSQFTDLEDQYGPELVAALQAMVKQQVDPLATQVADVRATALTPVELAWQRFEDQLTDLVSDWQAINADPRWLDWLDQPLDGYGALTRQQALDAATGKQDPVATAKLFQDFKTAMAPARTTAPRQPTIEPASNSRTNDLPAGQRMWSRAEINAFYDELRRGAYKGREAESRAIEDDIIAASREGRVR